MLWELNVRCYEWCVRSSHLESSASVCGTIFFHTSYFLQNVKFSAIANFINAKLPYRSSPNAKKPVPRRATYQFRQSGHQRQHRHAGNPFPSLTIDVRPRFPSWKKEGRTNSLIKSGLDSRVFERVIKGTTTEMESVVKIGQIMPQGMCGGRSLRMETEN